MIDRVIEKRAVWRVSLVSAKTLRRHGINTTPPLKTAGRRTVIPGENICRTAAKKPARTHRSNPNGSALKTAAQNRRQNIASRSGKRRCVENEIVNGVVNEVVKYSCGQSVVLLRAEFQKVLNESTTLLMLNRPRITGFQNIGRVPPGAPNLPPVRRIIRSSFLSLWSLPYSLCRPLLNAEMLPVITLKKRFLKTDRRR